MRTAKVFKKLLVHFEKSGIEVPVPGREEIFLFSATSRPALGHTQHPVQWVPAVQFLWLKRTGRESDHPYFCCRG
jgi:hypothetical protein